eukprot:TRINITY_DN75_c0_g1_i1.p1 TRINITY_DN75_c0_g1~~TRINITY_DN75_c0_g1_i1.p1  ORF type:complete len:241 (+),score=63.26 TRINITY_DN75_c0_g1_i1:60-725(+)
MQSLRAFTSARVPCSRVAVPTTPTRLAHGFPKFPENHYKNQQHGPGDYTSRNTSYFMVASAGVFGSIIVKNAVGNFVGSLTPGRNTLAIANIEVDLNAIPAGHSVTFGWRGKPLFVRHREQWEIDAARDAPMSELKDPEEDSARVKPGKAEYLVLLGICTHLGCVPLGQSGLYHGWFCPCHGSHYDTSGRVRAGPAPRNLEVPPYMFMKGEDNRILVGEDE